MSGQPTWVLCLRYIVIEYIHVGGVASDPGVCLRTDPWFLDHLFVAVVAGALYELDEIKLSGHHDGRNAIHIHRGDSARYSELVLQHNGEPQRSPRW